jgi:hypothetical protein
VLYDPDVSTAYPDPGHAPLIHYPGLFVGHSVLRVVPIVPVVCLQAHGGDPEIRNSWNDHTDHDLTLLIVLLTAGSLSDHVGRRPVVIHAELSRRRPGARRSSAELRGSAPLTRRIVLPDGGLSSMALFRIEFGFLRTRLRPG